MRQYFNLALKTLLVAVLAFILMKTPGQASEKLTLRSNIQTSDKVVRVGDLFENAGDNYGVALYRAPRPGKTGILNATRLKKRLARFNLNWENTNNLSEVVVRRSSQLVPYAEVEIALKNKIAEHIKDPTMAQDMEIRLKDKLDDFYISEQTTPHIDIRHLTYDARTGRFKALLTVSGKDEAVRPLSISGLAYEVAEVAVLKNPVERNQIITNSDINIVRLPIRQVSARFAITQEDIAGRKAKKNLRVGRPIKKTDIALPRWVKRGDLVTVLFETGNLTITARGIAMENGVKGRSIRVKNPHSKRMMDAVVTGPGIVRTTPLVRNLASLVKYK